VCFLLVIVDSNDSSLQGASKGGVVTFFATFLLSRPASLPKGEPLWTPQNIFGHPMTKTKRIKLNKEKRSNVFRLRLTLSERERWSALAEEVGLGNNLSKFVRHCVEKRTLPAPIPQINEQTYWELGKIGVNLNQITHAINRAVKEGSDIAADPRAEIEAVKTLLNEVRLQLLGQRPGAS
jgi:hypothetical protein